MANPFDSSTTVNAAIKLRRDTDAVRTQLLIEEGELICTTDTNKVYIGDGVTTGGILIGNKVYFTDNFLNIDPVQYDIVYRTDLTKFLILTGANKNTLGHYFTLNTSSGSGGTTYTLPAATRYDLGGLIVSDGLLVDSSGNVSVGIDNSTIKMSNNILYVDPTYIQNNIAITNATSSVKGVVIPKAGLSINPDAELNIALDNATLKVNGSNNIYVDDTELPLLKVSNGISEVSTELLTISEGLSVDSTGITRLKIATPSALGGIKLGTGLSGNSTGTVDLLSATSSQLGGIKLGNALSADAGGTVNVAVDNTNISINSDGQLTHTKSTLMPFALALFDGRWVNGSFIPSTNVLSANNINPLSCFKQQTGVYTIYYRNSSLSPYPIFNGSVTLSSVGSLMAINPLSADYHSVTFNVVQHNGSPNSVDNQMIAVQIW